MFELTVRRADDLLVLRFEFVNFALMPPAGVTPRHLKRVTGGGDALIIVHFPPQHIGEEVHDDGVYILETNRFLAGESRLVFRLPDGVDEIPLTMASIFDWSRFEPVLVQDDGPLWLGADDYLIDAIREPTSEHTAIELPFRMILAPHSGAHWEHSASVETHDGRVALWSTSLRPAQGNAAAELTAVWSPDLFQQFEPFPQSLDANQRSEIARISSLSDQRAKLPENQAPGRRIQYQQWLSQLSRRVLADQLTLSALGAWTRIRGGFNVPPIPIFLLSDEEVLGLDPFGAAAVDMKFSIKQWDHTTAMGRDLFAGTVNRGYLFPFGHRADLHTITRREFSPYGPTSPALIKRSFITIREPELRYADSACLPFTAVRMLIDATPDLGITPTTHFVPKVGNQPFAFPIALIDHAGCVIQTTAVAVWIAEGVNVGTTVPDEHAPYSRIDLAGKTLAYTPRGGRPKATDNTTLATTSIELGHQPLNSPPGDAGFQPRLKSAQVYLDTVSRIAHHNQQSPVTIGYHCRYVSSGANLAAAGGVFASIVNGLSVEVPASTAGGVIDALSLTFTGLSDTHGVVPNADQLAGTAAFGSAALSGLGGKLLGQFELNKHIDPPANKTQLPTITTQSLPGRQQVKLHWTPALKVLPPLLEVKVPGSAVPPKLTITAEMSQPDGTPAPPGTHPFTTVTGTLEYVALELPAAVCIEFSKIEFRTETGQAPKFSTDITKVEFLGSLEFINGLAGLLQPGRNTPIVNATPSRVSAGLALAVPGFTLGVLSLQNLAVSVQVNLYFSAQPLELIFAVSSRQHPFLASYSLFGGGGYFALTAGSDGTLAVEAAVELGAAASLNLVIAAAQAQVMLGVTFAMKGPSVEFGGYLRIFGSLEILGIATVSVDFHLSLTYSSPNAIARASFSISVRVLGYSKSVTVAIQRSFNLSNLDILGCAEQSAIGGHVSFRDAIPLNECWLPYCDAFAPEAA